MPEDAANPEEAAPKKGLPLVPIILVTAIMLVEAVVIAAVFMFAGGPSEVQADGNLADLEAELEQPVTVLVVADKFQNTKSGQNFLYDTEIYATVKSGQKELAEQRIETKRAEVLGEIMVIFRRAEPAHLHEPELSTLTRQVREVLQRKFGTPPGGDEPLLLDVIIGKCTEFASDY
jgi:flagellar basal body-associated protein FliL